ncbi:MAG: TetR/AcrR family transcriptional regulator, partial [Pseudomonadota bacterium]|nr:TetR/AcrR family transcriptional regulator [Pseudomonadota bacterium]
ADICRSIAKHLRDRIACDIAVGTLPAATDAFALAGLVVTLAQGLSVLARDGTPRASLLSILETGLKAWPQS